MLFIAVGLVAYLLLLCLLVLLQDFRRKTNVALVSFSVLLVIWLLAVLLLQTTIGESVPYTRLVFVLGLWSAGTLAWFTYELVSEMKPLPLARRVFPHGIAVYIILTLLTLVSPLIIEGLELNKGQVPIPVYGQWYIVYLVVVGFTVNSIVTWLFTGYHASTGVARRQLRTVAFTIGISVFVAFMTNLIVPLITGSTQSSLLFPISIAVVIVGLSYAIAKNGFLDIKAASVRSLAYVLSVVTMAGVYFSLAYVASVTFFKESVTTGISISPINVVLALILALVFQPVRYFFDRVTDKIFYRGRYDSNAFISRLSAVLTRALDLDTLLQHASAIIGNTLKASSSLFVVYRDNSTDEAVGSLATRFDDADYMLLRDAIEELPDSVCVVNRLLPTTESAERLKELLTKEGVALVLPLRSADKVTGYLLLGEQLGSGYLRQDIEILETLRGELIIAIQNARSVQEVRDLNTTLEQKIDDATRELRTSNKRLLELDAVKDEFVAMASHQLRTPLTSVKGYISMVLEGDAGKITKNQRQLLQEAFTSSERMVHLISDFLNVSRLQTGKFIVDRKQADLAEIVQQELVNIRQMALTHKVSVEYKRPARFPLLYLDEGKMRQVIMNFIDNAIYYSPDNTPITITLAVEGGEGVLRITDKGMGVPKEAQEKLFTKFFRAENARKQRPDGTGVGLFLAKKVIDGHSGSVVFESQVGQGSTFGFRLPIKKLSSPPPSNEDPLTV